MPLRSADFKTLAEALDYAAQGETGFNFYDGRGALTARLPYRELRARGASKDLAARIAANARRWWRNSAMGLHIALPNRLFDELGVPRLAA